jgi:hypothetical protein
MPRAKKLPKTWSEPPIEWDPDAPGALASPQNRNGEAVQPQEDTMALAERTLRVILKRVNESLESGSELDDAIAKQIPNVSRAVATIAGERRQVAKQRAKDAAALSVPRVMEYLRQLAPEKRRHVMRELEEMDQGRSVLS